MRHKSKIEQAKSNPDQTQSLIIHTLSNNPISTRSFMMKSYFNLSLVPGNLCALDLLQNDSGTAPTKRTLDSVTALRIPSTRSHEPSGHGRLSASGD